jgi:DNA-binding Lrp family transcriptional regulator
MPSKQRYFVRQAFETVNGTGTIVPLDATDRRIAAELQAAPRLRVAELARRIGLSGPAVADRLRRLEETGILSYRTEVNPRRSTCTPSTNLSRCSTCSRRTAVPRPRLCTRCRSRPARCLFPSRSVLPDVAATLAALAVRRSALVELR